ncbi:MAG TPA: J domain-containing protein [Xanthobacteraceae bacterium]
MFAPGIDKELSVALVNAVLLALWAVLPGLLLVYLRLSRVVGRMRADFSLRKAETLELNRAASLYAKVCHRLQEIKGKNELPNSFRGDLFGRRVEIPEVQADEIADLEAYRQHLRASIVRLRGQPLKRLRWWFHIKSSHFALGRALAAHILGFALLIVAFHVSRQQVWTDDWSVRAGNGLVWYPLDPRLFYANAIAIGFAAVAAPVYYTLRWSDLRGEYALEFCAFKEFAASDPSQIVDQPHTDHGDAAVSAQMTSIVSSIDGARDKSWFEVLGVSHRATIEEIKETYKALIKQNHPDRVHGMSPAFRELAEAETRKLNSAYQQALMSATAPEAEKYAGAT